MKNQKLILLLSAIMMIFSNADGQNSGSIIYEQKSKLNIDIDDDNQEMLSNVPKEHISSRELIFDSTASIFQSISKKNEDETIEGESGKGTMVIKMNVPDDHIYCDLIGKRRIEQRDFMSRKFLIEIPFSSSSWKLTGRQKDILNYPCQEAILQDTIRKVTAWFTSAIPLSTGPSGVCNLPGLVLRAELNGGEISFEAKSIDLKAVDHKSIVRPTEGKKVSREEFNKIVMEKNKEMDEQGGGNGNVIIHIKK